MDGTSQRRVDPRTPILAHVHWINRQSEGMSAELCDVSSSGFFLTPNGSFPESVGVGDPVWIIVNRQGAQHTLAGTVRWRGFSQAHGCIGCGVLLDRASMQLSADLFPQTDA
jgi:hypothetical protein